MAESAEHAFLSEITLDIMEESANSQLFTCRESGRKRFDFSCDLARDWTRAVSGQTLWRHDRDGIDKDLRTLLTDDEAAAAVYVASDSVATRGRVDEVIRDYRNSPLRSALSKLRIFWVPSDFHADDEKSCEIVRSELRRDIHRDLLLRVALGGLTSQDVRNFAISGSLGAPARILFQVKKDGFLDNYTRASKHHGVPISRLKQEILRLELTGMVSREENEHGLIQVTDKGSAMLDICARLHGYLSGTSAESSEFFYICKLLGMDFLSPGASVSGLDFDSYGAEYRSIALGHQADNATLMLACLYFSSQYGDIEWSPSIYAS